MTDQTLKKLDQLLDKKIEPLNKKVDSINKKLDDPEKGLDAINKKLDDPEKGLDGLNDKMDILMGEMIEIKKLTETTNELVRVNKEIIDEDITDIKKHLGLSS